jgi:hypothetical protein
MRPSPKDGDQGAAREPLLVAQPAARRHEDREDAREQAWH